MSSLIYSKTHSDVEDELMQVAKSHIMRLIDANLVAILPREISAVAAEVASRTLPIRSNGGADWSQVTNSCACRWMTADDAEAVNWARQTTAGRHSCALLLYSSDEPCLSGDFEKIISNLDTLIWTAPGSRFIFGLDMDESEPCVSSDIIEFDGIDRLFGVRDLSKH